MPDSTVSKWKQSGLVYLWRYLENTRNYPGWHLKTDEAGRQSLLGLLQKMHAAKYSSRATVHLSAPTMRQLSVPNNRHGQAAHRAAEEWLIVYPKGRTPDQTWKLSVETSR